MFSVLQYRALLALLIPSLKELFRGSAPTFSSSAPHSDTERAEAEVESSLRKALMGAGASTTGWSGLMLR